MLDMSKQLTHVERYLTLSAKEFEVVDLQA